MAVDLGDPALPVAGQGALKHVAVSRRARWRAAVLIGIHLIIAVHATHYLIAGRTISPVEPSEAMYTLERGEVNAGFIFFAVALLATLLFGRFFCGWGCHLVALQDLCGWMMKKLGIRPRPFRSRLMLYVPLGLALYMFVWPTLKRWVAPLFFDASANDNARWAEWLFAGTPQLFAGFRSHLTTEGFWDTFPGPLFAVLTFLTCGFVAVYMLGAKGFCTYACPYGGFFAPIDRLSPGRIRVTDACEQCGHCTATCTSNVQVHSEVRTYGMVVDPGCMKCMDCVSVCPKDALYYGFGKIAMGAGPIERPARPRRFGFPLGEELALLIMTVVGTLVFRGLYDGPPLLMSVCLGAVTAFLVQRGVKLVRARTVRLQNLALKEQGRLTAAGRLSALFLAIWLAFTLHSGAMQWQRWRGRMTLDQSEATRAEVLGGSFRQREYSQRHQEVAAASLRHFELADRWGLFPVAEVKLGLAWGYLLQDELELAEIALQEAIALNPGSAQLRQDLIDVRRGRGDLPGVIEAMRGKLEQHPSAQEHFVLAGLLIQAGDAEQAVEQYLASLELTPDSAETRHNLGGLLRRMGRNDEAALQLEHAVRLMPTDPGAHIELALAYAALGRRGDAIELLERAIELDPESPESRLHLPGLIEELRSGATR